MRWIAVSSAVGAVSKGTASTAPPPAERLGEHRSPFFGSQPSWRSRVRIAVRRVPEPANPENAAGVGRSPLRFSVVVKPLGR